MSLFAYCSRCGHDRLDHTKGWCKGHCEGWTARAEPETPREKAEYALSIGASLTDESMMALSTKPETLEESVEKRREAISFIQRIRTLEDKLDAHIRYHREGHEHEHVELMRF